MKKRRYMLNKWDDRFLELARNVSGWSKYPRTKVGAVIVKDKHIVATGYNGFHANCDDDVMLMQDRDTQLKYIIHAEANALYQANLHGVKVSKSTIYVWPLSPCAACAKLIVKAKISRVVAYCGQHNPSWEDSFEHARRIFKENNVEFVEVF